MRAVSEADNPVSIDRNPGKVVIEIVVEQRLTAELAHVDRIERAATVPKVNYIVLVYLQVIFDFHHQPSL